MIIMVLHKSNGEDDEIRMGRGPTTNYMCAEKTCGAIDILLNSHSINNKIKNRIIINHINKSS